MSFWHVLQQAADRWGDDVFLTGELGGNRTRHELLGQAARIAGAMRERKVKPGDRVVILAETGDRVVALEWALAGLGAIQVPLNPAIRGLLLADVLEETAPSLIAVTQAQLTRLREDSFTLHAPCGVFVLDGDVESTSVANAWSWEDAVEGLSLPPSDVRDHDAMVIIFTSGTTGRAKGVVLSHRWGEDYSHRAKQALRIEPGDRHYGFLPLFHIAGQYAHVTAAAIGGASVALSRPFRAGEFWEEVDRYRCTAAVLMSSMLHVLRNRPLAGGASLRKLHLIPLPTNFRELERELRCRVTTNYGSTEASIPIRNSDPTDSRSCGRLDVDGYEARIVDEWDEEMADGEPGELILRPRRPWMVMSEYWKRPDATAAAWRNGWLHTGDLFVRRPDGHFEFLDRTKDAIRRRGENISSFEVEVLAALHPAILESAAVAVDTGDQDQEVALFYTCKPHADISPAALTAHMESVAPRFMVPRYLCAMPNLPRTDTGKIQKAELRRLGFEQLWDRRAAPPGAKPSGVTIDQEPTR